MAGLQLKNAASKHETGLVREFQTNPSAYKTLFTETARSRAREIGANTDETGQPGDPNIGVAACSYVSGTDGPPVVPGGAPVVHRQLQLHFTDLARNGIPRSAQGQIRGLITSAATLAIRAYNASVQGDNDAAVATYLAQRAAADVYQAWINAGNAAPAAGAPAPAGMPPAPGGVPAAYAWVANGNGAGQIPAPVARQPLADMAPSERNGLHLLDVKIPALGVSDAAGQAYYESLRKRQSAAKDALTALKDDVVASLPDAIKAIMQMTPSKAWTVCDILELIEDEIQETNVHDDTATLAAMRKRMELAVTAVPHLHKIEDRARILSSGVKNTFLADQSALVKLAIETLPQPVSTDVTAWLKVAYPSVATHVFCLDMGSDADRALAIPFRAALAAQIDGLMYTAIHDKAFDVVKWASGTANYGHANAAGGDTKQKSDLGKGKGASTAASTSCKHACWGCGALDTPTPSEYAHKLADCRKMVLLKTLDPAAASAVYTANPTDKATTVKVGKKTLTWGFLRGYGREPAMQAKVDELKKTKGTAKEATGTDATDDGDGEQEK